MDLSKPAIAHNDLWRCSRASGVAPREPMYSAAHQTNVGTLAAQLLRFDTSNPPGGEAACIGHMKALLGDAGLETRLVGADRARPNLVARLKGSGTRAPLLLQGHVDVVPAGPG